MVPPQSSLYEADAAVEAGGEDGSEDEAESPSGGGEEEADAFVAPGEEGAEVVEEGGELRGGGDDGEEEGAPYDGGVQGGEHRGDVGGGEDGAVSLEEEAEVCLGPAEGGEGGHEGQGPEGEGEGELLGSDDDHGQADEHGEAKEEARDTLPREERPETLRRFDGRRRRRRNVLRPSLQERRHRREGPGHLVLGASDALVHFIHSVPQRQQPVLLLLAALSVVVSGVLGVVVPEPRRREPAHSPSLVGGVGGGGVGVFDEEEAELSSFPRIVN
eukprot:CAMPEP_0118895632 /NCGR_PEP_ID=MMETSP1166-20130328/3896_1 /TAXON_ID=1104430 /ORGANISM="Chrysoreinhardia sp, Strain CCMP3193" /LENGTH=272 /DNA_ID=CAMNT_0006834677 /DNA_START=120 /DNA_END=935 /DNA_ORIENTATION=-